MPLNPIRVPRPRPNPKLMNYPLKGSKTIQEPGRLSEEPIRRSNPRSSDPTTVSGPRRSVRWLFYALALIAIPLRMWWDAPLLCAHFGWFCR